MDDKNRVEPSMASEAKPVPASLNSSVRMLRSFILFDNRDFLPRPFQIELYEACKSRDSIIFLRPGNGKHFLTVMLVKYFTPKPPCITGSYNDNDRKKIFFLAKSLNSIRLYSSVFKSHTDLLVSEYFDTKYEEKKWSQCEWRRQIGWYDIHIMMDSLFEQLIEFEIVTHSMINLLILDDVHKILLSPESDCYKRIVRYLQIVATSQSFRILGLSASILLEDISSTVFYKMIQQIEEELNCKCETYADLRMINKYSIPCRVKVKFYPSLITTEAVDRNQFRFNFSLFIIRNYCAKYFDFLNNLSDEKLSEQSSLVTNRLLSETIVDILTVYGTLGEWCTLKLIQLFKRELTDTTALLKSTESSYLNLLNSTLSTLHVIESSVLKYLAEDIRTKLTANDDSGGKLTLEQFFSISSPKLHLLASIFKDYIDELCHGQKSGNSSFAFPSNLCSIVYAEKRATVRIVALWIGELVSISAAISPSNYFAFLQPDYVFLRENSADTKNFYYEKQQKSLHEIFYYRKQEESLKRFRFGNYCNVLVTTSMSAEGLDINRCNLVVCFDPPKTFHQFIQSKGRVRVENGQFVVMVEDKKIKGDEIPYIEYFHRFVDIERIFTKLVPIKNRMEIDSNFTPISGTTARHLICESGAARADRPSTAASETRSGTIQLTMENAISILNRYCLKLPSDTFTKLSPHFTVSQMENGLFQCQLYLPINSTCRDQIVGEVVEDKLEAKRSAALNAVKRLREVGELDANYYPIGRETNRYIEKLGLQDCFINNGVVKTAKETGAKGNRYKRLQARNIASKRRQYYGKKVANCLTGSAFKQDPKLPDQFVIQYLYMFEMKLTCSLSEEQNGRGRRIVDPAETSRTFGIVVPNYLPPICDYKIYNRSGEVTISLRPIVIAGTGSGLNISREQKQKLCNFHVFTFEHVLRLGKTAINFDSENGANGSYIVVPIDSASGRHQIDWNFVDLIDRHSTCPDESSLYPDKRDCDNKFAFDANLYADAVVIPKYRRDKFQAFFYVAEICYDLNPLSRFPDSGFETFEEYYSKKYSLDISNLEQPLLDVDHTSSRLNLLTPRFLNRKGLTLQSTEKVTKRSHLQQKQILIPELCLIHPFPASFWRKAVCLPCILYRLNSLLVAEELRFKIAKEANIGSVDLPSGLRWPSLDFGWSLIVAVGKLKNQESQPQETVYPELIDDLDGNRWKGEDLFSSMGDWNSFVQSNSFQMAQMDDPNDDYIPSIEIIGNGPRMELEEPAIVEIDDDHNRINEDSNSVMRIGSPTQFDEEIWTKQNEEIDWLASASETETVTSEDTKMEVEKKGVEVDKQYTIKLDDLSKDISTLNVNDENLVKELYHEVAENVEKSIPTEAQKEQYSDFEDLENDDDDLSDEEEELFDEDEDNSADNDSLEGDVFGHQKRLDKRDKRKLESIETKGYLYDILQYELLYDCNQFEKQTFPQCREQCDNRRVNAFEQIYREEKEQVLQCVDNVCAQNSLVANDLAIPVDCYDPEIGDNGRADLDRGVEDVQFKPNQTLLEMVFEKFDEDLLYGHTVNDVDSEPEQEEVSNRFGAGMDSQLDEVKFGELLPNREQALEGEVTSFTASDAIPKWLQSDSTSRQSGSQYCMETHPSLILQAITMSNSNDGINLERLETVGDSFLKYSITAFLFCMCPDLNEGKLSFLRSRQISNINLHRLGQRINLGQLMIASKFEPSDNWCPPSYQLTDSADSGNDRVPYNLLLQHSIPNKSIADCVEALIGAYLVSAGSQGAIKFMDWLGLKVLPKNLKCEIRGEKCQEKWLSVPKSPLILASTEQERDSVMAKLNEIYYKNQLNQFEKLLGYRFKDRAYLVQAFTHNSYYENNVTDCYQRLEFLGDAVLDYLITRYLYEDSRCHSPGTLTDLRSALVNNTFFASLAVKYNFHKYLMMLSSELYRVIDGFVRKFNLYNKNGSSQVGSESCMDEHYYSYWELFIGENEAEHLEDIEVPKALGDIFESVAGAIYLDSGMSLEAVWKAYYPMMKPEIEYFSFNVPKSPIRVLLEKQPQSAKFGKPEITSGRKIRVCVEVFNVGKFVGIARNKRIAKCIAAKRALRTLRLIEENKRDRHLS